MGCRGKARACEARDGACAPRNPRWELGKARACEARWRLRAAQRGGGACVPRNPRWGCASACPRLVFERFEVCVCGIAEVTSPPGVSLRPSGWLRGRLLVVGTGWVVGALGLCLRNRRSHIPTWGFALAFQVAARAVAGSWHRMGCWGAGALRPSGGAAGIGAGRVAGALWPSERLRGLVLEVD